MNERLKRFLQAEALNQQDFATRVKVSKSSISHILSGRNQASFELIKNTLEAYPKLNAEWLILGKGKMFKNSPVENTESSPATTEIKKVQNEEHIIQMPGLFPEYEQEHEENMANDIDSQKLDISVQNKNLFQIRDSQRVQEKAKKIDKVLIFYNDNTFVELK